MMKTSNAKGNRVGVVVLGLLVATASAAFTGDGPLLPSSQRSGTVLNGAAALYRQPGARPVGLRKMRLNCSTVHVEADKATGEFTVKCEVESNEVGARTEFVKVTAVTNLVDLAVDFPQVQPQKGSSVEVEASGKLPPGVDAGVFILSICNADGVEEDRALIRVRRAP